MARYTKYLFEYLNDGFTLPETFGYVPTVSGFTFAQLFTNFYKWSEIGYDTEWRFHDALESRANLITQGFVDRINKAKQLTEEIGTDDTEERTTYAAPAATTAGNNEEAREKITRSETADELLRSLAYLNAEAKNLYVEFMLAFRDLFMGVW